MKFVLISVFLMALLAAGAVAGTIAPGLSERYDNVSAGETLPVLIVLESRLDAVLMQDMLLKGGLELAPTHERVMDSLRARAERQQPAVMRSIEILRGTGMAGEARGFWLGNVIAADLTRAGAELIANMAEVREVGLDEDIVAREFVNATVVSAISLSHIETIKARDAWDLGYRGENRTVCILADGVDGNHPAIAPRWRGTITPPEQCWFDPQGTFAPSACGESGTVIASLISSEASGVAPASQWIAASVSCEQPRLSHAIAALQWAVDPDGYAETFADVPDAICSAWGLDNACGGAAPADIWEIIDHVEALGPVVLFSSADTGQEGAGSVRAPESRGVNFAIGMVDATREEITLASQSSRGPSPCDGSIKPDLVAPGVDITASSARGNLRVTGSAAAAAQATGAIALMRQANSNLSAHEIKRMLSFTATDLGTPKADNLYGNGLLNVQAAVELAQSARGSGTLEGYVRYGGTAIGGARVTLHSQYGQLATTTNWNGAFRVDHLARNEPYTVEVGRFGYQYYVREDPLTITETRPASAYINLKRGIADNAENDQGWQLGVEGDNATGGVWERAIPQGTRVDGKLAEPDADATADGEYCFVTGAAASPEMTASESDVDGGKTTLRSPLFSLMEITEPALNFSYFFSNDLGGSRGGDFFRAQISNDGGATWTNLINTAASTHEWKSVSVKIADFVTPTDQMLLQFVAEDEGLGSLVEAAVDDIAIIGAPSVPEPPRDLLLDVQFDQIVLTWRGSADATGYRVYLSRYPDGVVKPENLFTTTSDTTLTLPIEDNTNHDF